MKRGDEYSLNVYSGEISTKCLISELARIKMAFPTLPQEWYNVLSDRLKTIKNNDNWLRDAVNELIDTCVYPQPTIANVLSYGKEVKLFTYQQMQSKTDNDPNAFQRFVAIDIGIKNPMWASKEEAELYKLKLWKQ